MPPPLELAIPSTTLSSPPGGGRAFTLYNITLRLPLRTFVVQKRYSDFLALHGALTSLLPTPPPAPMPAKAWFRSTVSSPELTESRRHDLEAYLRAIAESHDAQWRQTSVWRAFLNLPMHTNTGLDAAANANANGVKDGLRAEIQRGLSGGEAAKDPVVWMDIHREVKTLLHDARLCLGRRDSATTTEGQYEAGAGAKKALVKVAALLSDLDTGLKGMESAERRGIIADGMLVGKGELRRRRDLVASARTEQDGLEKLALTLAVKSQASSAPSSGPGATTQDKDKLFGPGVARPGGRVLGAPVPETAKTRELDNEGVLQLQKQLMVDQDVDVAELAKIVRRQKEMAGAIRDEVDLHNEMLQRVDDDAARVQGKVDVAKKRIGKIS